RCGRKARWRLSMPARWRRPRGTFSRGRQRLRLRCPTACEQCRSRRCRCVTNSSASADPSPTPVPVPVGWRWAPAWVLAFVALWPAPGYAEAVMVLGALAAIVRLLLVRIRDGSRLLSGPAWALTSVLFCSYWLPELLSAVDAI